MGQPAWNVNFWKGIVKPSNPLAWPNLVFGGLSSVRLGDYGALPSVSGGFRYAGNIFLDGLTPTVIQSGPNSWTHSVGKFREQSTGGSVTGSYWDPETQLTVDAGIGWSWQLSGGETIITSLPQVFTTELGQPVQVMAGLTPSSALYQAAAKLGYLDGAQQVKPGFAVVTAVYTIVAGMVVCTTASNQIFQVSGVASGMSLFMSGSVGGYYNDISVIENTETMTTPPTNVTQSEDVPPIASSAAEAAIAYATWTWDGKGGLNQYVPH